MRLGYLLKIYRVNRGIDAKVLAIELGTSASTLSRLENGKSIDVATLGRIMAWLTAEETAA